MTWQHSLTYSKQREISQLRTRIAELEVIVNRTPQQKQELQEKRQELAKLEGKKQQGEEPKKTNWTPWLIGGRVILVLAVGIITFFLVRKDRKK